MKVNVATLGHKGGCMMNSGKLKVLLRIVAIVCYITIVQNDVIRIFGHYNSVFTFAFLLLLLIGPYWGRRISNPVSHSLRDIVYAVVWPYMASFVAYVIITMQFRLEQGHFVRVAFLDWLFAAALGSYLAAKVWLLSILLLILFGANQSFQYLSKKRS